MSAEHAARWQHKRTASPTRHWPADPTVVGTHDGTVASCATCRECLTCGGSGVIDTTPANASHPAWQSDTECPRCEGSGER